MATSTSISYREILNQKPLRERWDVWSEISRTGAPQGQRVGEF